MPLFNLTDAELKKSATTYRKDLLVMPVIGANQTLQHMCGRPGVAGRETVGQLGGGIELGPYDASRVDNTGVSVAPRTLETFLGSVVKRFDVNEAAKTVYGQLQAQGQALTTATIARAVLDYLSAKLGQSLNMAIFSGKRNDSGTKTTDLFDGFDTITQKEIDATTLSAANGNLVELTRKIDENNARDVLLNEFYRSASDELQGQPVKMFVSRDIYNAYCEDYLKTFGAVAYNTQYKQTFLTGSDNLCEIVPLTSKKGSSFIHLTPKANMLYGYGAGLAEENIAIEKYHEFLLSYVATMYFGVQFETISKERLFVAKLKLEE